MKFMESDKGDVKDKTTKTYYETKEGFIKIGNLFLRQKVGDSKYDLILKEVDKGNAKIVKWVGSNEEKVEAKKGEYRDNINFAKSELLEARTIMEEVDDKYSDVKRSLVSLYRNSLRDWIKELESGIISRRPKKPY